MPFSKPNSGSSQILSTSVNDNSILPVAQAKNLGVSFDSFIFLASFPHIEKNIFKFTQHLTTYNQLSNSTLLALSHCHLSPRILSSAFSASTFAFLPSVFNATAEEICLKHLEDSCHCSAQTIQRLPTLFSVIQRPFMSWFSLLHTLRLHLLLHSRYDGLSPRSRCT